MLQFIFSGVLCIISGVNSNRNQFFPPSSSPPSLGECTSKYSNFEHASMPESTALRDLAVTTNGELFTLDSFHHQLLHIDRTGVSSVFASARDAIYHPLGVAVDSAAGVIYVSSQSRMDCYVFDSVCCKSSKLVAFPYTPFGEELPTGVPEHRVLAEVGPNSNDAGGLCQPTAIVLDPAGCVPFSSFLQLRSSSFLSLPSHFKGKSMYVANTESRTIQTMPLLGSFEEAGGVDNFTTIMEFKPCHSCLCLATPDGSCPSRDLCDCIGPQHQPLNWPNDSKGGYFCLPNRPYCVSPDEVRSFSNTCDHPPQLNASSRPV
jgi:hypothetical protein